MRFLPSTAGAAGLLLALCAAAALAQTTVRHEGHDMASMGDSMASARHLKLTPHWPELPGDRSRADSLVGVARAALGKYADVADAERDGYRMFAPAVKQQRVYHYSKRFNALKARWTFDATAPSALLYQPERDGRLRLIGAMYTAPPDISLDELNRRIPLSIARWHQHTSLCLPPGSDRSGTGVEMSLSNRDPRFGPRGSIATAAECQAAGGTFRERMFGWMVHVNLFEDPEHLWEHRH